MGKKLDLKSIQNPKSRRATFSKRKNGLLKKAFELSVLCDVEVALVIFSEAGKIYEFSSNNNMARILGKYRILEESAETSRPTSLQNAELALQKLQERLNILQIREKNLVGEDLELLTMKELQQLEHQLEIGAKRIRHMQVRFLEEEKKKLQSEVPFY